jgi:hypothetical protein
MFIPISIINNILDYLSQIQSTYKYVLFVNEKTGRLVRKPNKYNKWFKENSMKIIQNPSWIQDDFFIYNELTSIHEVDNDDDLVNVETVRNDPICITNCYCKEIYSYSEKLQTIHGNYIRNHNIIYCNFDDYYAFIYMYSNENKMWLMNKKHSYLWKNGTPIGKILSCDLMNPIFSFINYIPI